MIASQQKPTKSLTARSSTQHVGKSIRSNLDSVSVAAPMSSTAVDYHHPMTQVILESENSTFFFVGTLRFNENKPAAITDITVSTELLSYF